MNTEGRMEEEKFTSKKIVFDVEQNQKHISYLLQKLIDEDEGLWKYVCYYFRIYQLLYVNHISEHECVFFTGIILH